MIDIDMRRRLEGIPHAIVEKRVDIRAETAYHASRTDDVLQNQRPADKKCYKFTHCDIAVNVRGSGTRHSCSEFGITESWEEKKTSATHLLLNSEHTAKVYIHVSALFVLKINPIFCEPILKANIQASFRIK